MYFEFVPFRDSFLRMSLKRNQVLKLAPTEVLFTPRASVPSLPLARLYPQKTIHPSYLGQLSLLHSALVQVLRGGHLEGIKNPEGRSGTSGLRLGTSYVPVRRCLRSSMLPLSRLIDGRGC